MPVKFVEVPDQIIEDDDECFNSQLTYQNDHENPMVGAIANSIINTKPADDGQSS